MASIGVVRAQKASDFYRFWRSYTFAKAWTDSSAFNGIVEVRKYEMESGTVVLATSDTILGSVKSGIPVSIGPSRNEKKRLKTREGR